MNFLYLLFRFLLKDELIVVQTEEDLKKILTESRGKENIILTNVKEIGMKGAREFFNENLIPTVAVGGYGWIWGDRRDRIGQKMVNVSILELSGFIIIVAKVYKIG
jgi:hypothetical protein